MYSNSKVDKYKLVRAKIDGKFFHITVKDDGSFDDWNDFTDYLEINTDDYVESYDDGKDNGNMVIVRDSNYHKEDYDIYDDDDDEDDEYDDEDDEDEDDDDDIDNGVCKYVNIIGNKDEFNEYDNDEDDYDEDDEDDEDDDDDEDDEDDEDGTEDGGDELPENFVKTYDGDRYYTNACDKDWEMLNDIRYTDYSNMVDDNNTYWRMIPGDDPKDFSTVNETNDNDLIYGREHDPRWIKVRKDEEIKWTPSNFINGREPIPEEFIMAQQQITDAVAERQKNFKPEDRHGYILVGDYDDYHRKADEIEDYIVLRRKQLERARNKAWVNPDNHRLRYMRYTYEPSPEEIYAYNRQRAFEEIEGTSKAIKEVKKLKRELEDLYKERKELEANPPSKNNKKKWNKYDKHLRDIKGEIVEREIRIKAYNDPNLGYNLGDFSAPAKSKEQLDEENRAAEEEIKKKGIINLIKHKIENFVENIKGGTKSMKKSIKHTIKNAKKYWKKNGRQIIKSGTKTLSAIAGVAFIIAKLGLFCA